MAEIQPCYQPVGIGTDRLVAKHVMKWTQVDSGNNGFDPQGTMRLIPAYTTDLADSHALEAELRSRGHQVEFEELDGRFIATVIGLGRLSDCSGHTRQLALARAAIRFATWP
jgi:hypothetical protein